VHDKAGICVQLMLSQAVMALWAWWLNFVYDKT